MTRVLFCVIPEKGHLHPYIGPAQWLTEQGVEVAFYAERDLAAPLAAAGLPQFVGTPRSGPPPDLEVTRGAAFAAHVADPAWLRRWIESLLVDAAAAQVEPLRRAITRLAPDVVAIDPMVYAAAIACELDSVPWAALSNSLNPVLPDGLDSELLRTVRAIAPARDALFARYGLTASFRGCDLLSPRLTVAFCTEALTGGPVPGVALVGPSRPRGRRGDETPFPWERLRDGVPLVYMSLGSQIYYQPAAFRAVLDALAGRAVDVVIAASELVGSDALGALPDNATAVRYAPQLALLERARVLVTHGGANSVMEAIACGVPMLISPLCNDQFHQVHFVEAAGIGRALDLRAAPPDAVAAALDVLLADGPIRARMARVAASYQVDGAAEAGRRLLALTRRA
jgi:UDP:flavonoid glycosyltransferase YjiC (YdhE family)